MVTPSNPMAAFVNWFETLPVPHKKFLAHLYRVCTTDNTIDMAVDPDTSLERFKNAFVREDFPLRIAARVFSVRAVFDLIMMNTDTLAALAEDLFPGRDRDNVELLSSRQWESAFESWKDLRFGPMSDMQIHAWAKQVMKHQMK